MKVSNLISRCMVSLKIFNVSSRTSFEVDNSIGNNNCRCSIELLSVAEASYNSVLIKNHNMVVTILEILLYQSTLCCNLITLLALDHSKQQGLRPQMLPAKDEMIISGEFRYQTFLTKIKISLNKRD